MARNTRITIKPHNQAYFEQLQHELGYDNASETLNYLLTNLKTQGFSLLGNQQCNQVQQPTQQRSPEPVQDNPPKLRIVENMPIAQFEEIYPEPECDHVIERLMAAGLESF